MIEVKDLCKRFGAAWAVDRLSFIVEQGEILGFLGPNGAGKTTTIRILTGFFPPHSGQALIGGKDVVEDTMAVRAQVGYLPESAPLYHDMRVSEYLRFVGGAKGLDAKTASKEADRVIESVALAKRKGQLIGQLSKGYRQRVGLAQALVGDPPVLILDEPSIGLDPGQIVEIRSLIREFAGTKTVMLSSHILPEVEATCDRVIIINQGRLAAEVDLGSGGAHDQVRVRLVAKGEAEAVSAVLSAVPGVSSLKPDQATQAAQGLACFSLLTDSTPDTSARLARAVVEAGFELIELAPATSPLEDIFLSVIRQESATREEAA